MGTPPRRPGNRPGPLRWVGVWLLAAAPSLLLLASPAHAGPLDPSGVVAEPTVSGTPSAGGHVAGVGTSGNRLGAATVEGSAPVDAEELVSFRPAESDGGNPAGLLAVVATVCVVGVSVGVVRAIISRRTDNSESL